MREPAPSEPRKQKVSNIAAYRTKAVHAALHAARSHCPGLSRHICEGRFQAARAATGNFNIQWNLG